MAQSPGVVRGLAAELIAAHARDLREEDGRIGLVRRYLQGGHDLPYMPKGARLEYRRLAERSITNWLPLISETFVQNLHVDGFRPAKVAENSRPWSYWQANGLDARQGIAHRGALEYGASYVLVLKGDRAPLMRPISPTRALAWYEDEDDEWPVAGLIAKGRTITGDLLYEVLDGESVYTVVDPKDSDRLIVASSEDHGMRRTPLVRFRDRLDGEAAGIIRPLKTLQDRVNEVVFALMVAMQYASFRQRWATGLAIPEVEERDPATGEVIGTTPKEPFEAAVDRLWVTDNPDARFGDFAQTEVSGHLTAYDSTVRTLAGLAQISPNILTGDLVNLSADALAQMEAATQRRIGSFETIFGESWEQAFRLAAFAAGDREAASDTSSEVRWRDTEARSLAQTVDALGKIAQMLAVPPEALWEKIPGVTDGDVQRWKTAAEKADGMALLAQALDRQAAPAAPAAPEAPAEEV